jgi:hypothetical protein
MNSSTKASTHGDGLTHVTELKEAVDNDANFNHHGKEAFLGGTTVVGMALIGVIGKLIAKKLCVTTMAISSKALIGVGASAALIAGTVYSYRKSYQRMKHFDREMHKA